MRVAAIDIGTNSVLLLVAELGERGLVPVVERATITRLGRGVDATRRLDDAAVERTLACLEAYADELRRAGATRVDAVGTSALRDASGGADFIERARAILGVAPRVVSGAEEAALTFAGALTGIEIPSGPAVVFDVGGGSTEIVIGERGPTGAIAGRAVSLDVGSVRLTERHVRSDPPEAAELEAVRRDVRGELAGALGELGPVPSSARLVGVAGTVTTLAAYLGGVAPYDASRVHGARLDAPAIRGAIDQLSSMPLASRREIPAIDPARADVIVAGAILVEEVLAWSAIEPRELVVSDRGVRWGLAEKLASAAF
jgi:exopolyphosphatase/guanosine-5'-triphosphate,3'-diphosphate pyrophosphatase